VEKAIKHTGLLMPTSYNIGGCGFQSTPQPTSTQEISANRLLYILNRVNGRVEFFEDARNEGEQQNSSTVRSFVGGRKMLCFYTWGLVKEQEENLMRYSWIVLTMVLLLGLGAWAETDELYAKWEYRAGEGPAESERPVYGIQRAKVKPALDGAWTGPAWKDVPTLSVDNFYRTDNHKPVTQAKVLFDDKGLYIHFRVDDQYVRTIETEYHGKVWEDACVEFFVQPKPGRGYFNFEINSGGTMLLSYKEHPSFSGKALRKDGSVPWELAKKVKIYHSLPKTTDPEDAKKVTWQVEYHIPYTVFESYLRPLGEVGGQTWKANFYKCAENNSHPHWASWAHIGEVLSFHLPKAFSSIVFEK
jgi:hypothetical protein